MVLEVALLDIIPEKEKEFEIAFSEAQNIIASMRGYHSHQLQRCIEKPNRYVLLVEWDSLTDHTEGFRQSLEYVKWKALLHHFYNPFPEVEHYQLRFRKSRES
jgi:heme-degrading monooxygenase HmoA